ncbi:DUF6022 family protein [Paenibacillus sp. P25]|nr:DUF6022 family protein [Paenibacillus sp. P25]
MKTWNEFKPQNEEATIHSLAKYMNQYVRQEWERTVQDHHEELLDTFDKIGEPAYGRYLMLLLQPLFNELADAGFVMKPGFIVPNSLEQWGPPEERERCMWCVVKKADGSPLGTLVLRVFHSHVKFDIPLAPDIFALEVTDKEAIIEAVSHAAIRLNHQYGGVLHQDRSGGQVKRWEYSAETGLSDYLKSGREELEITILDHALSRWGRQGWELTSVVPYEGRLIAFFKRPYQD